jgi:hypothetical protein
MFEDFEGTGVQMEFLIVRDAHLWEWTFPSGSKVKIWTALQDDGSRKICGVTPVINKEEL